MPNSAVNPGQAVVEYELIVPNKKPLVFNALSVAHIHSIAADTIYEGAVYRHRLRTANTDFVDNQIKSAMATGTPRMRFRLGVGVPDSMFWLPWQEHVITHYSAILESANEQAGHTLEIETMDFMFLMTRSNLTLARKGRISKIVTDMATEFNLKELVIESTSGVGAYIQSYMDSATFIRRRMVCRARNDKGRGNYLFYFKDGALHFHSPAYQAELHTVVYYQAAAATVAQTDNSQRLLDQGAAGTTMTAYDPMTGKTVVSLNDPDKSLRYSDSLYNTRSIPSVNLNLFTHVGPGIPDEGEIIAQNLYEHSRGNTFNLTLEVDKTIQIRHGDVLNLIVAPTEQKTSPWSGYYLVTSTKHIVQKNAVRSSYTLARGEIGKSLDNLTNLKTNPQDILVIEQAAPGQPLNIGEIKSSERTKGAGSLAADGRLFRTVQSPN